MPNVFLVMDLVFKPPFRPRVACPKYSLAILLFLPLHYVGGEYDGLHLSTQNYT